MKLLYNTDYAITDQCFNCVSVNIDILFYSLAKFNIIIQQLDL